MPGCPPNHLSTPPPQSAPRAPHLSTRTHHLDGRVPPLPRSISLPLLHTNGPMETPLGPFYCTPTHLLCVPIHLDRLAPHDTAATHQPLWSSRPCQCAIVATMTTTHPSRDAQRHHGFAPHASVACHLSVPLYI